MFLKVKLLLALLLFGTPFCSHAAAGDSVVLHGKVILVSGSLPSTDVNLNPYNEGGASYNTYLNSDGSFEFALPIKDVMLYEVRYGGYTKSILFTKTELSVGFTIYVKDGKPNQMFITNSFENVAHENLRTAIVAFRDTLKGFRKSCEADKTNCQLYWGKIITAHNTTLQKIAKDYPETFTAKVLVPLSKSPEINGQLSPTQQLEQHYFDGANFTDTRIFSTPDIATKFIGYLNDIADTSNQARFTFISNMFLKTMGSPDARKSVGLALYNLFSKSNKENYLQSLEAFLDKQDWSTELLPVVVARLKLASKVLPGSKAPEIAGLDAQGNKKLLSEMIKSSKLTMVIFWSSDCMHCRESMPDFLGLYEKYKPAGLRVFAASLDTDPAPWKTYLNEHPTSWTNVNIPESNTAYNDYFIQATPSIALIDKKGVIVHRFMDVKDLDEHIANGLK